MKTEQDIEQERLRRILELREQLQPTPAPKPIRMGPDLAAQSASDPYLKQASELEMQAQPVPGPRGAKEHLVSGLQNFALGFSDPQNYQRNRMAQDQAELDRQETLRQQALQLRQMGIQSAGQARGAEEHAEQMDFNRTKFEADQASDLKRSQLDEAKFQRANELADRPQFTNIPAGQAFGSVDPKTAELTPQGIVPPNEGKPSETDEDFADYLKHPELTSQYGADRTGFRKYQTSQAVNKQVSGYNQTTAQNPSIIWGDDPDNSGKQAPFRYNEQTGKLDKIDITKTPTMSPRAAASAKNAPTFINKLKDISDKLITNKTRFAQLLNAFKRGGEAAVANEPEYRTYQDFRGALAATIGVMEQDRLSDADAKMIYLPMVPNLFTDTEDSAKLKWDLIYTKAGMSPVGAGSGRPRASDGKGNFMEWDGKAWVPVKQ